MYEYGKILEKNLHNFVVNKVRKKIMDYKNIYYGL